MKLGDLSPKLETYICEHVFRAERDVKLIAFNRDGTLQMLCGENHDWTLESGRLVCAGHLLDRHPALKDLDMAPGHGADLTEAGIWRVRPFKPERDRT